MYVASTEWRSRVQLPGKSVVVVLLVVSAVLAPIALVRSGAAHAEPRCSNLADGDVVNATPAAVDIWFSEEVDPTNTKLTVVAPGGTEVHQGDTRVDLYDPNREHVTGSLKPGLEPGTCTVRWHSVSATDGDAADGAFTFTVAASGTPVAASPRPETGLVASPSVEASPHATPEAACS